MSGKATYLRPALEGVWCLQQVVGNEVSRSLKAATSAQCPHFFCHSSINFTRDIWLLVQDSTLERLLQGGLLLSWVEDWHQLKGSRKGAKADDIACTV